MQFEGLAVLLHRYSPRGEQAMRFVQILVKSPDSSSVSIVNKVVYWLDATQTRMGLPVRFKRSRLMVILQPDEETYEQRVFQTFCSHSAPSPALRSALHSLPLDTWVQLHSAFITELMSIAHPLVMQGIRYFVTAYGRFTS